MSLIQEEKNKILAKVFIIISGIAIISLVLAIVLEKLSNSGAGFFYLIALIFFLFVSIVGGFIMEWRLFLINIKKSQNFLNKAFQVFGLIISFILFLFFNLILILPLFSLGY